MKKIIILTLILTAGPSFAELQLMDFTDAIGKPTSLQDIQAKELENQMRRLQIQQMQEQLRILKEQNDGKR